MAKRVPAGEMRHSVIIKEHKIERNSTGYDSFGQLSASSTALTTVAPMRAKIEQLSGNDLVIARQKYPYASYQVTVDYNATLASTGATRRVAVFNSRELHIGAVINEDMENVQIKLLCGEER